MGARAVLKKGAKQDPNSKSRIFSLDLKPHVKKKI